MKKPRQMPRLEWVRMAGASPAWWSGSLGHVPQTLIALPNSGRSGLMDATTDLGNPHKRKSPARRAGLLYGAAKNQTFKAPSQSRNNASNRSSGTLVRLYL